VREEHEIVRIEEPVDVGVRQKALMRWIAETLEPIHLEASQRIDRPELVGDEHTASGPSDPHQLGYRELRAADVVENAETTRDVERRVAERERCDVALDEADVGGSALAAGIEVIGSRVRGDDVADVRSER
jgi:hypothetical protein